MEYLSQITAAVRTRKGLETRHRLDGTNEAVLRAGRDRKRRGQAIHRKAVDARYLR